MPNTGASWFSAGRQVDTSLALADLTNDQLRERLLVAETMMKRLYTRNKELEL
jgi:hypothetical protein